VHHLEAEEAGDLGNASGVVADPQGAVMRRSVAAPAVDELGRGQGEGDAGGGVADAKRPNSSGPSAKMEELRIEAARMSSSYSGQTSW
jgi:hypothetical protein